MFNLTNLNSARFLTVKDKNSILDFFGQNTSFLVKRTGLDPVQFHAEHLDYFLSRQRESGIAGRFNCETGKLDSILGIHFWELQPVATLVLMMTSPSKRPFFDPVKNGLSECLDLCLTLAHEKGVHVLYSARRAKTSDTQLDSWHSNSSSIQSRYLSYTEAIVPAGTKPYYRIHWELLDQRLWPYDVEIRCTMLDPSRRANYRGPVPLSKKKALLEF